MILGKLKNYWLELCNELYDHEFSRKYLETKNIFIDKRCNFFKIYEQFY